MSRYDYHFDPDGDSTPARICRLVGHSQRVLELGCAAGAMSIVLAGHYGCQVTALESDSAAIDQARALGVDAHLTDLDAPDWSSWLQATPRFDTILAADVLEHLHQPLRCLKQLRGLLAPEGKLVLSVPNIAHSGVLAALLCDAFPYRDTGLLDRTHVHFFTRHSLVQMLAQAGFAVDLVQTADTGPWHPEFSDYWDILPPSVRALLAENPAGRAYQVFAVAHATANASLTDDPQPPAEQIHWLAALASQLDDAHAIQARAQVLRQERDQALADLTAIRQSTIWRWSAPLRRLLR